MIRSALVTALGILLAAPSAAAGGGWWSVIEVPRAPLAAGERVEVKASLYFRSDARAEAAQQPGRYRVYLLRGFDDSALERAMQGASPGDWWSPGAAEVIEVGPVTVRVSDANFGRATAAFTVPELAAGSYHVMLCDAGCANPLTDVIPTEGFTVVADPATAQPTKRSSAQPTTPPPTTRWADAGWLVAGALAAALTTLVLRRSRSRRARASRAAAP